MNRRRRTIKQLDTLDEQLIEVLRADRPQSVRHLFYRMTDPRLAEPVDKTEHGYKLIIRRCLRLRRSGRIPYGWISDATRRGFHVSAWESPGDFLQGVAGMYRGQLWGPDLPRVEVWTESRSLAGVLQTTCRELAVSLYPCGGFSSATLCYEAAQEIDAAGRARAVVLFLGDFDPAGVLIDRHVEAELRRHLETPLELRRLAINPEQIAAFDLPQKPRKAGDRRRLDIEQTVEAEAMPAGEMRRLVREAVESYLPAGALQTVRIAEESEREWLELLGEKVDRDGLTAVLTSTDVKP